jgi:Uma2 family endonuclease
MISVEDIQRAIRQLSRADRDRILLWASRDLQGVQETAATYDTGHQASVLSVEEYLALERTSPVKHEYLAGQLFAMVGVSRRHSLITLAIASGLRSRLAGGPCEVHTQDFKLRLEIDRADAFYYPDVMVACGGEGIEDYYLRNPRLIVEVLSPTTEAIDRREKALGYRRITTLKEYVMVAQDRCEVTFQRRSDGFRPAILSERSAVAEFRSVGVSLALEDIYSGVPT